MANDTGAETWNTTLTLYEEGSASEKTATLPIISIYMAHIKNKTINRIFHKSAGLAGSLGGELRGAGISRAKGNRAQRSAKILQRARKLDNAPDFANGKPTDAFKLRTAAARIRQRAKRN